MFCCVPFCKNNSKCEFTDGTVLYAFPKNEHMRRFWIAMISGVVLNGPPWKPPTNLKRARVCEVHFEPEDFTDGSDRKVLHNSAIPSRFPGATYTEQAANKADRKRSLSDTDGTSSKEIPTKKPWNKTNVEKKSTVVRPILPKTAAVDNETKLSATLICGKTLVLLKQPDGSLVHDGICNPSDIGKRNLAIVESGKTLLQDALIGKATSSDGKSPLTNSKQVVFTDKSGKRFMLVTTPLTSVSTTMQSGTVTAANKNQTMAVVSTGSDVKKTRSKEMPRKNVTNTVSAIGSSSLSKNSEDIEHLSEMQPVVQQNVGILDHDYDRKLPEVDNVQNSSKSTPEKPNNNVNNNYHVLPLSVQLKFEELKQKLKEKTFHVNRLQRKVAALGHRLGKQNNQSDDGNLKTKANKNGQDAQLTKAVKALACKANNGDHSAGFLIDQINRLNNRQRFSECTVQYCAMWAAFSTESYNFIREMKLLNLPSTKTLKRCLGHTPAGKDVSVNTNLTKRLQSKFTKLSEIQKVGTLVIRDMRCVSPETVDTSADGQRDDDGGDDDECTEQSTSKTDSSRSSLFLSFSYEGINLPGNIPLLFHYMKASSGEQLKQLTLSLLEQLENAGLRIIRIVSDCWMASIMMYALLGDGEVRPQVPHPVALERPLFLSCSHIDVMRHVRLQFVDLKQQLSYDGCQISRIFLRRLYDLEKKGANTLPTKLPARKGIVCRSSNYATAITSVIKVFCPNVTSSLRYAIEHIGGKMFKNGERTLEFLEIMYKWCMIQDVCNSPPVLFEGQLSDEDLDYHNRLLAWLESDFSNYLEKWHSSCTDPETQFLTSVNYGALSLTTMTSVLYVRYLLHSNFRLSKATHFAQKDVDVVLADIVEPKNVTEQTLVQDEQEMHINFTSENFTEIDDEHNISTATLQEMLQRDAAVAVLETMARGETGTEEYVTVYLE